MPRSRARHDRDPAIPDDRFQRMLEVYYAQKKQLVIERLIGRNGHRTNYRHVIWSLVQKPAAFARYRYREDLFPSVTFRRAYDAITQDEPSVTKDLGYLRILHLAAATSEADVGAAQSIMLDAREVPEVEAIKTLTGAARTPPTTPTMPALEVDLGAYDALLEAGGQP